MSAKTKDGFYKVNYDNTYVLLANGLQQKFGNDTNNIPYSNGVKNASLNADLLDGLHIHEGRNNEANKVVRTDGSGYIQAGWINTTSGDMSTSAFTRVYVSNDQYIRYVSNVNFIKGIGGPFLPLVGGTMTGTIHREYTSSNDTPFIWINSGDYDNYIFQVSSGTSSKQYYGYALKYIGTGSGIKNFLRLYADNQNSTDVIALGINQSGNIGIGSDALDSYRLYVSGNSVFYGHLYPEATNAYDLGSPSLRWRKLYIGTADSYGSTTKPIYWNNGVPAACTYSLNANVNSGTINTLAYYSAATTISSGSITTDGAYLGEVSYLSVNTPHQTSYRLRVDGDSYITGWSRAGSGFYVHDQGVHYTYQQGGMPLIYLTSNEFNFGQSGTTLYFNYRASRLGTTTTNYVWNAGSSSSWANHNMGNIWLNGSGVYLRIGPQNSSHAHYETNAGISHWFNKRVDVNGAIWRYNTNYGIADDGRFYALSMYANRSGSSTDGGVSLYSDSNPMTYGIAFRGTGSYGTFQGITSDWATYFTMNDDTSRGWMFRRGSTNVLAIDGYGSMNRFMTRRLRLPGKYELPTGWYRLAKIQGLDGYFNFNAFFTGGWNWGAPTAVLVNCYCWDATPRITQISGQNNGVITKMRLYNISGGTYYLDIYNSYTPSGGTVSDQYVIINGSVNIVEVYEPTSTNGDSGGYELTFEDINGHVVTRENAWWANLQVQSGPDTSKYPQFGSLSVINDSQNNGTDGLVYFRNYSNNDWGLIVDKSQSYTYGVDIRAAGGYALRVADGNTRLIGATIIGADDSPAYTLDVRGTTRSINRIYANEWIQFDNWTGLYSPNNGAHFYPNNTTSFGQWQLRGSRSGYSGIHFGDSTHYMTLMDNYTDKGIYQEDQRWILYYNANNGKVSLRDSSDYHGDINLCGLMSATNYRLYGYANAVNCDSIYYTGMHYYNSSGPSGLGEASSDGGLYSQAYSSDWVGQIAQDYRNGHLFIRGKNGGSWTAWDRVISRRNSDGVYFDVGGLYAHTNIYAIRINGSGGIWNMLSADISVRSWSEIEGCNIQVSGVHWSGVSWNQCKAIATSTNYWGFFTRNLAVWLYSDGSNDYIFIQNAAANASYCTLCVNNILYGDTASTYNLQNIDIYGTDSIPSGSTKCELSVMGQSENGIIFGGTNSWFTSDTSKAMLQLGGYGASSDRAKIFVTNGDLHIQSYSGYGLYLNWYSNNWTYFGGVGWTNSGFWHASYGSSDWLFRTDAGVIYWPTMLDYKYYQHFRDENFNPISSTWHGYGTGMTTQSGITGHWWHIWSSGWSDNTYWISQIAVPTADGWDSNHMMYRTYHGGDYGWRTVIDNTNIYSYTDGRYLQYEGWWSSGSGQNVNDAHGIIFAYSDHGVPGSWGTLLSLECERGNGYRHQIHGRCNANELWHRYRNGDNGSWSGWAKVLDTDNSYVSGSWGYINGTRIDWTEGSDRTAHLLINGVTWWSNWYWSGQSGQPTWLWGSNDGTNMYVWNPSNFSVNYASRAAYLDGHGVNPNSSHPGYGARIFYSWNIGQAYNDSAGYSNGITIGSHPGDQAYGFQIVQNMWDDNTYTRRYNGGWQEWKTLLNNTNYPNYLDGHYARLQTWNNLIHSGNEFTFAAPGYSGGIWINYRTASGGADGNITEYIFGRGNGNHIGFYVNTSGAYHTSDIRKKYDIRDILNKDVNDLFLTNNGFIRYFKWKDSNKPAYGFIAQEIQEYCPECIELDKTGYYSVNYNVAFSKIIGAMFKKIKQLEYKIYQLENNETSKRIC